MGWSVWGFVLFVHFTYFLESSSAAECLPPPIHLPVGNTTVNKGKAVRGVLLSIGAPRQNFSFVPRYETNNTYIYTSEFACSDRTDSFCATHHGGWYSSNDSSTFAQSPNVTAAGGVDSDGIKSKWLMDNFTISTNVSLAKFPIGNSLQSIGDDNYNPQAVLGLGQDSTILNSLKNGALIGARVWSYFNGLTGITADTQSDGSLVLGGYDAGKVSGPGANFSMVQSSECPFPVNIEDISVVFPNGTSASITSGSRSSVLKACLNPSFPVMMTLPYKVYYENFKNITGMSCANASSGIDYRSSGPDFYALTNCDSTKLFAGDFAIKIQQGPTIKITNDQLIIPEIIQTSDGTSEYNTSSKSLLINTLSEINENDSLQLGRHFFSAAYMMANLDKRQFTLWSANPSGDSRVVAVDQNGALVDGVCTPNATTVSNTTTPQSTASQSAAASQTSAISTTPTGPSVGTIAGIVIGAAGAIAVLVVAALLLRRRLQNRKPTAGVVSINTRRSTTMGYMYADHKKGGYPPAELALPVEEQNRHMYPGPYEMDHNPPSTVIAPQELDGGYEAYRQRQFQ